MINENLLDPINVNNEDFDVEVKFLSQPSQQSDEQGLRIEEEGTNNYIQFTVSYNDGEQSVNAGLISGGRFFRISSTSIPTGEASFLRVNREGVNLTLQYSADGQNWINAASFEHGLSSINQVGVFGGNQDSGAFTPQVEYFQDNNATPIPNEAPIANDDIASVAPGETVSIDVLENDSDINDNLSSDTVTVIDSPANGTITIDADGVINYTHDGSATTSDSFTYTVADGDGAVSTPATVNLTIAENQPPVTVDDSATVSEGNAVIINILANDSDSDGTLDPSSVTIVDTPSNGTLTPNPDGTISYTHDGSATTSDSFTYTVADDDGAVSTPATVNLTITPANSENNPDPINVNNEDFEIEVNFLSQPSQQSDEQGVRIEEEGTNNYIQFTVSYDDGEQSVNAGLISGGRFFRISSTSIPTGEASFLRVNREGVNLTLQYSADGQNWITAASFEHGLSSINQVGVFGGNQDGGAFTPQVEYFQDNSATPIPNEAPIANDDIASVAPGETVSIDVLENDSDINDNLSPDTVTVIDSPANGTITIDANGVINYTHDGSATTSDSFTYTVADGDGAVSTPATVNLTIAENQLPTANEDNASVIIGNTVTIDVLVNDNDPDGNVDNTSLTIVDQSTNGTVATNSDGTITYTHNGSDTTSDTFTYTVSDDDGAVSNIATVNLTVNTSTSGGPVIDVWNGLVQEFGQNGRPQNWVNILGNVSDSDGIASLSYSLNGGTPIALSYQEGLRLVNDGDFNADITYTDLDGSPADDIVTITATDNLGNVSTETVTIDYETPDPSVFVENYTIDWSTVNNILDVAQPIDGNWELTNGGVSISGENAGYDRLLGIGDIEWDNYEVTVPITMGQQYLVEETGIGSSSGIGVLLRWNGHTIDSRNPNAQPRVGFFPLGGIGWYVDNFNGGAEKLQIVDDDDGTEDPKILTEGNTYIFKMRVEDTLGDIFSTRYSLKVWEQGLPEPPEWDLIEGSNFAPEGGGLALITHRREATFGNVVVTSLTDPINQAPIANDDIATLEPGETKILDILSNDTESDGTLENTSLAIVGQPTNGTVNINNDGTVTYSHDGSATTNDSFIYTVADNEGEVSNTATVNLTIAANQSPTANDDNASVIIGNPVTIDVLVNDNDPDGNVDNTSLTIVDQSTNGTVTTNPDGTITYTHNGSDTTSDTFTYTVSDDDGAVSNIATVNLTVNTSTSGGPLMDVWHGSVQQFGQNGQPQNWINILGNVNDPDGVASLSYSLNGSSPVPLNTGPNGLRLEREGDFNVDIAYSELDGSSVDDNITITAVDELGNISTETVTIEYEVPPPSVSVENYSIDWSSVNDIFDVGQPIDGKWGIEGDGIRTIETGYDRLLGFGDISWDNYEVEAPVTINQLNIAGGSGVGFITRWNGHTNNSDDPQDLEQPRAGFFPLGGLGWYTGGAGGFGLQIINDDGETAAAKSLQEGETYIFKMRVEDIEATDSTLYSLKVWEQGQAEPTTWDVQSTSVNGPDSGGVALLAHRNDVTFGDVTVTPLENIV